ncbi:hypothetical protein I3842_Q106100 [Carya illinoinensis]|uniref:PGG domain-containing protein n=1 Tax=Carya illinoinensis TaxID=32201 RepID=A0A922D062_CARIL|nr:hypothetical protein I3842_Q106100 [Carya illinoinensis]
MFLAKAMAGEGGQIKEGQTISTGTTELMTKEKEGLIKRNLFTMAMNGQWDQIVEVYKHEPCAHKMRITKAGDTALHIAISQGNEQKVKDLVQQIIRQPRSEGAFKITNSTGNTPLHIAASKGNVTMCQSIANVDQRLVGVPNGDGETPFFLSVLHGKKEAFFCLHDICGAENGYKYSRRKDGDTILHCAIARDYLDLAFQITHWYYENLVDYKNEQGLTPLHVLASKPSAFRSGSLLRGYNKIIYHCIFVDNLQAVETSSHHQTKGTKGPVDNKDLDVPENYKTCTRFFKLLWDITKVGWNGERTRRTDAENPKGYPGHQLVPANYRTCFDFAKLGSMAMLIVLGFGMIYHNKKEQKKQTHKWAFQVLKALLTRTTTYEYHAGAEPMQETFKLEAGDTLPYAVTSGSVTLGNVTEILPTTSDEKEKRVPGMEVERTTLASSNDSTDNYVNAIAEKILALLRDGATHYLDHQKKNTTHSSDGKEKTPDQTTKDKPITEIAKKLDTPILIAAKNGITEIVDEILKYFPVAIDDLNVDKKNIVLLAVENRQPNVYQLLLEIKDPQKESVFRHVDNDGNSAQHLAARLGDYKPWLIPGAALQMQWENKWHEYVKNSMPLNFFPRHNNQGKTPSDLFTETHKDLVKNGSEWLTNTSQSCSVVAVLIATVAFASSTTVPGGFKEDTDIPVLQNKPGFDLFAISSLVALCFSLTALVLFLAILTSRYEETDFGKGLPRKLLVGLTSLFVSIAAMLLSFCGGHFFVLKEELKFAAFRVYAVTCLPVTFFAAAQFPLYFDLLRATFSKVPQRSYKIVH